MQQQVLVTKSKFTFKNDIDLSLIISFHRLLNKLDLSPSRDAFDYHYGRKELLLVEDGPKP